MKKFCQENLYKVTQPLIFFVQKKLLDVHMIVHKCQKNSSIHIENSFYQSTLRETWKKPKSQNCFKIWISVVECMPINEWNMILSFKKVKHWFLVVKGVNYSTKIDLIELSRSKWSHPIQIKALIIKVWKNIVKPNGTNRKDQKMASESPGLVKTVFKTNRRIFLKLMHNHMHIQPTFLNRKIKRFRDSKKVF